MNEGTDRRAETIAGSASSYELAYDEAVRVLSEQQSTLDNTRTRAGTLVAAAAIATSFLGGQALRGASPSIWTWLAIFCFLGLGAVTALILLPQEKPSLPEDAYTDEEPERWEEDEQSEQGEAADGNETPQWGRWVSPSQLINEYIEVDGVPPVPKGSYPIHLIHRDLALHMERTYDGNLVELNRLNRYFQFAAGLLALEILAWVVDLASGP